MSYTIAQNTSLLTAASIIQKIISFGYFTLIAGLIGVGNTGTYFFAISFTAIFTVVADFGLGPVLTREAAKYPENSERYVSTILWTKILFGVMAYVLAISLINLLGYSPEIKTLVYLSGVTMFFDSLQSTFYSIFRSRKNLLFESIGVVGSQLITLIIGTAALVNNWPLIWLIAAYTIPSFLNLLYAAYFARRTYGIHYRLMFEVYIFKTFIVLAAPFALAGIISRLYAYSDSILMSKFLGPEQLGWWSVPYKITFAFQFIPMAIATSIYPVMSKLSISETTELGRLFEKAWTYLFLIVFPLALGLGAIARPVIVSLYGVQYLPSVAVLQILLASLIFGFLSFITGALLNATNRQKIQTGLWAAALGVNILINLLLLPRVGIVGAAIAALAGNIILCLGGFYFVFRSVPVNGLALFLASQRSLWPAIFMAAAVYGIAEQTNFLFAIVSGVFFYLILLFFTGALNFPMLKEIYYKMFRPKAALETNKL